MEMKVDRRVFLKSAGAIAAAGMVPGVFPSMRAAAAKPQKFLAGYAASGLGITIDKFWQDMEAISKSGIHNIETDNTQLKLAQAYADKPNEFKERMAKLNLRLVGLNAGYPFTDTAKHAQIREENTVVGKFLQAVGGAYIGSQGALTNDEELIRKIAKLSDEEGKRMSETFGIKLSYHTHSSLGFRRLMDLTTQGYLYLTPDLAWLARGYSPGEGTPEESRSVDALEVCRAYLSRICTVHMKDYDPTVEVEYQGRRMKGSVVLPGKGVVNFPAAVEFLREAEFSGFWMGEFVGIGTYERERTGQSTEVYPYFAEYMTKTLGLNLGLKL